MSVPLSLLLEQGPMLKTLARALFSAAISAKRPRANPAHFPVVHRRLPAPSRRLIRHYAAWCGAPESRYANALPPHLFTQFALPVWAVQLEMTRYPLVRIINQGCGVTINATISPDTNLDLRSTLVGITEKDNRARIHQQLTIGTQSCANALAVDFYATFILGKHTGKKASKTAVQMVPVAAWNALAEDGFRFGLLTGDLNPIHWIGPIARRSVFNGKVMHGFGMFARSFETLQNATQETIQSMDVRFIRPAALPSPGLRIMCSSRATPDGIRKMELRSRNGHVLMAGHYIGKM